MKVPQHTTRPRRNSRARQPSPCAWPCTNPVRLPMRSCLQLLWQFPPKGIPVITSSTPMTYLIKLAVRSGGTSRDWSCVSCASAQHFTASCLPASPARLWVLVWQGVAAYQTGQAQLLLCCVSMKYVLWELLLENITNSQMVHFMH